MARDKRHRELSRSSKRKETLRRESLSALDKMRSVPSEGNSVPAISKPVFSQNPVSVPTNPIPGSSFLKDNFILRDKATGMGFGIARGRKPIFTRVVTESNRREFTTDDLPHVTTVIFFDLPFRVSLGTHCYIHETNIYITFRSVERSVAQTVERLGLTTDNGFGFPAPPHLTIEPDNWGISSYSQAIIVLPFWLDLSKESNEYSLLKKSANLINQFLDAYCLATGNYRLPSVSYGNIPSYTVYNLFNEQKFNFQRFFLTLPETVLIAEPPLTEDVPSLNRAILDLTRLSLPYKMAYGLLVEARRAMTMPNPWLATVAAVSAIEVAVFHFIDSKLKTDTSLTITLKRPKRDNPNHEIELTYANFAKKNLKISLDEAMNQLLVQALINTPLDWTSILEDCNKLRNKRNDAIHDITAFDGTTVDVLLLKVHALLDSLSGYQAYIPEPQSLQ